MEGLRVGIRRRHIQAAALVTTLWGIGVPTWAQQARDTVDYAAARKSYLPLSAYTGPKATVRLPALYHLVTIHLNHVPLERALTEIASQAGLGLSYESDLVTARRIVSLNVSAQDAVDALHEVLRGTGWSLLVSPLGQAIAVPDADRPSTLRVADEQQGTATISGYVRDSATGTPIAQARVRIDGTTLESTTGADGHYRITGVTAGEYRVTARRVGYIAHTRTATLGDGMAVTMNVLLNRPATTLNEVVTTAVGDQRRYEVGNVISTINVDSLAPTAPVTSVTDLLSGRAPGVDIRETSGLVGSGESIRIRGMSSLLLQSDPIIIVDGIREDNAPGGMNPGFVGPVGSPSRINDIDFSQIETIDVLKGPSAATEYGTDAANGVIVITTKRGAAGAPQWGVSAEQAASSIPVGFPNFYYSYGHIADGNASTTGCFLTSQYSQPASTTGACIVDSTVTFNPFNHPAYTIFGTGPTGKYDVDVGGGSDALRYYVAAGIANATGAVRIPGVFRSQALAVGFPSSWLDPNSENQRSARANTTIRLTSTTDLQVNVAYLSTYQITPKDGILSGLGSSPLGTDSAHGYGYGTNPLVQLGQISSQATQRWTGGATMTWRPAGWLTGKATFGVDHDAENDMGLESPQQSTISGCGSNCAGISLTQSSTNIYTVDLRGTATAALTNAIHSSTSVGMQVADNRESGVGGIGVGISVVQMTLQGATTTYGSETASLAATLGGYIEEQLAFSDRLFLTGAVRVDAGSGFGSHYTAAVYPKLSASWLILNQGATTLRLRGAYGPAGQQPSYGSTLVQYLATQVLGNNGTSTAGLQFSAAGNPRLQPERSVEVEGGLDLGLWGNRLSAEVTAYSKTTDNALYNLSLGWDAQGQSLEENLGKIRNSGLEASVTAAIVQTRTVDWTIVLSSNINTNELLQLAPGLQVVPSVFGGGPYFAVGYPLYGFWGYRVNYTDQNRDGILESNEVSMDTALTYFGSSAPREEASLGLHFGLLHETFSVGGLFDYQTGFLIENEPSYGDNYREEFDPTAPLPLQARYVSNPLYNYVGVPSTFFAGGTFLRFRELSLTYALPHRWARVIHTNDLSLTGAVRNLALWTHYPYGDPEVSGGNTASFAGSTYNQASNQEGVNNDIRDQGASSIPLTRYWTVRLNVRF